MNIAIFKDKVFKGVNILKRQHHAKRQAKRAWDNALAYGKKARSVEECARVTITKANADIAEAKKSAQSAYDAWEKANLKAKELGV